ncbi:MAG: endo-1,4-beta-xylanase, partial [Defluviitaleaceae bacterium]|nr:endo-1,4-beta-xylanase [Defluviitaleaceae bacterium]
MVVLKRLHYLLPVAFILIAMLLTSCGSTANYQPREYDMTNGYYQTEEYDPEDMQEPEFLDDVGEDEPDVEPGNEPAYPTQPIETLMYSMAYDPIIQTQEHGIYGVGAYVLSGVPYLGVSGSPVLTVVAHPSGEGNAILISDRQQNFYALDINLAPLEVTFGAVYAFTVSGRAAEGITMQLGRTDAPWSAYATAIVPQSGTWYITHTLTANQLLEHFVSNQRGVRIMTANAPTYDFYIDSIEVVRIGERGLDEPVFPEWDLAAASLAESFAGHFMFGNIWSTASRLGSFNTMDGFLHHFNAVTAENNHKVDTIAANPDPNNWTFTTADYIVAWAEENDLAMIGHTLVWHSQSPPWLTTVADSGNQPLTRAQAIANMHLYISTVAGRYAGSMYAWDVVNEAIWGADASRWRANPDWRAYMRSADRGLDPANQSQWYDAFANGAVGDECGSDYIYYAFRFARIYDPFAILYYNDYNDHVPGKRDAIAQMVIEINERWRSDPSYDGRLLIEGIGMQAHYSIRGWMTNPAYVRSAIELYITTGARLSITEWDITIGGSAASPATMTQALLEEQAARFGLLMSWYLEFADYIERVSVWGLADHHSWISWGYPVLFDTNFHT